MKYDPTKTPDGKGWYHRIDDIPELYSKVEIITREGDLMTARVIPCNGRDFTGIGAEVQYDIIEDNGMRGTNIFLSDGVVWIRLIADD